MSNSYKILKKNDSRLLYNFRQKMSANIVVKIASKIVKYVHSRKWPLSWEKTTCLKRLVSEISILQQSHFGSFNNDACFPILGTHVENLHGSLEEYQKWYKDHN